jgi:hypothetical protein
MRNHDYSRSFPAVKDFIHQNSQKMKSPNKRRNYITWMLAVLLPLLIFFSCKRETYIEPQEATLSFTAKDSAQSNIEFAVQQYADKKWRVIFRPHAGTIHGTIYAPSDAYSGLKTFSDKLKIIPGVIDLYISAFNPAVKESRLSRLSYKLFDRHVDAKSATDEQLRTAIELKLKESGLPYLKVQLINEYGKKLIKFVPTGNNSGFSLDLTLPDGTNVTAISEKR